MEPCPKLHVGWALMPDKRVWTGSNRPVCTAGLMPSETRLTQAFLFNRTDALIHERPVRSQFEFINAP